MAAMRRSASSPTLVAAAADQQLEIFVCTRPLACKLPHVPEALQKGLLHDIGCAHYYTVVRQPSDGSMRALDFGPVGGRDIAFKPARPSLWQWARTRASAVPPQPRGTPGEVREMMLAEMPQQCMFVGRTNLSLKDIRSFNNLQQQLYLLHQNDCRHYVNSLVQYACGIQGITRQATRHIYTANRRALAWTDKLVLFSHHVTDVGSWPRVQRASQTAMALLAALGGRRAAARLGMRLPSTALRIPAFPAAAAAASASGARTTALARVSTALLPQPRVYGAVTAAATATYAASHGELSLLSSIGESIKSAAAGAGVMLRGVRQRAGSGLATGISDAAASGLHRRNSATAVVTALCATATRGSAGLLARRSYSVPAPRMLKVPKALPRPSRQRKQTGAIVLSSS